MNNGILSFFAQPECAFSKEELIVLRSAVHACFASPEDIQRIFVRLHHTVEKQEFINNASDFFLLCISLVPHCPNGSEFIALLEKCGKCVDDYVHCVISDVGEEILSVKQMEFQGLSQLVILLSLVLPSSQFSPMAVLELFEGNIRFSVCVMCNAFALASGSRPGISPILSDELQLRVVASVLDVIRSFYSWQTYELVISNQLKRYKRKNIPMTKISGQFRHHIGELNVLFMKLPFLHELGTYYDFFGGNRPCTFHRIVIHSALLIENLVTMTDQFVVQVRRSILHSQLLERFFLPFLESHCPRAKTSCRDESVIYALRALGTFAFGCKGIQASILRMNEIFISFLDTFGAEIIEDWEILLVFQLSRVCINASLLPALAKLGNAWNSLKESRKKKLFEKLSTNFIRFSPVDTRNDFFKKFVSLINMQMKNTEKSSGEPARKPHSRRRRYKRIKETKCENNQGFSVNELKPLALLEDTESDEDADSVEVPPKIDLSKWRKGLPPSNIPLKYICSLTHKFIQSVPVLSPQGYLFDEISILSYLDESDRCPITGIPLRRDELVIDQEIYQELQVLRNDFLSS